MSFTDYQVHLWLADLLAGKYLALHFDSPIHAGAYASEISGDGYVRAQVDFTAPSNRAVWNTNTIKFSGLPASTLTYLGGWDARNSGNLLWSIELPTPARVLHGGGYTVLPNELALSFG